MSIRIRVIKKVEYGDTLACLHDWTLCNLGSLIPYDRLTDDGCGTFDILKDDVLELLKPKKLTKTERAFCRDLLKRMGDEDYLSVACF